MKSSKITIFRAGLGTTMLTLAKCWSHQVWMRAVRAEKSGTQDLETNWVWKHTVTVQSLDNTARWSWSTRSIALLRYTARNSAIVSTRCWSNALSIVMDGWNHYFFFWGMALVCFLFISFMLCTCASRIELEEHFSDPALDMRNACAKCAKTWKNSTSSTPQKFKWCYQPTVPIERSMFRQCALVMAESRACTRSAQSHLSSLALRKYDHGSTRARTQNCDFAC